MTKSNSQNWNFKKAEATPGNIAEDNPLDATPIEEPVAEEPPVAEEEPVEDNPDRFASKTQEELLEIVREQGRRIGQQGNELGNLRITFEALSKLSLFQ